MKSKESKTSKSASHQQTRSSNAFFGKKIGESFAPEQTSTHSQIQTKASSTPFFGNSVIQTKLEVHPSDDVYEKEADAMADRIMQHEHAAPLTNPDDGSNNGIKTTPLHNSISRLQRQRAFESPTILETNSVNQTGADELSLQKKSNDKTASEASSDMVTMLNSSSGQGASLPKDTREKMESGFGSDFSNVNVHTGENANQMNDEIGAKAFTHGNDIYFNKGEYQPGTKSGDHLLAHELTHTIQQTGGVQKKSIQKGKGNPNLKNIKKATPAELSKVKAPTNGYIEKQGGTLKLVFTKLLTKKYLSKDDGSWLPSGEIKFPTGERHTKQAKKWKDEVKTGVETSIDTLAGAADKSKPLMLSLKKSKKAGIVGSPAQLANESLVPGWSIKGSPSLYDIEHMIDWQIAGPLADNPKNLILLDRTKNRKLGNEVRKNIEATAKKIIDAYRQDFSIDDDATVALNMFQLYLKDKNAIQYKNEGLGDGEWYSIEDLLNTNPTGNPLQKKIVSIGDAKIPKNHFLLITSAKRPGYILPNNISSIKIGAFEIVKVKIDKSTDKLESIIVKPLLEDPNSTLQPAKKGGTIDVPFDSPSENTYKIQNTELNRNAAGALKEMIGGVKGLSPIEFNEPEIDGFDVKITGKINSTLSIFKKADITFGYDNGMFFIRGVMDLTQLAESFPKPFQITACSVTIEANSLEGLFIAGSANFKLGSFGEGMIAAKAGKNVEFKGSFNFDSKWFKPAEINFDYKNGKWGIGGSIGIEEGTIKGVKQATLAIRYADETFSAEGNAKLDVPGIDSVKLAASYNEGAGFKFVATADLKKLPGIQSGSVTVSILSKGEEEIKLGVSGTAVPDFPKVPGLTSSLTVSYDDGIFDMRAKVGYKKGRFDGTVEVGVTNKIVDDKGQPQGEPQKGNNVVVFGFGSLTVDLFKGSKGTISVRLTPDKQLLVAGSFTVQNVKPFGDGVNIKKGKEFPSVKIPLVGIPGVSIFFEIGGGAYFTFNWDPLVLKELTISFTETNINEIETAQVNIHGEIGSKAVAEAYMELKASLGAEVLIAEIKGSLAGQAGIRVEAEAGGSVDATWNNEKGLQLKQVNASLSVDPKAFFRLKGSISVDLDLWITTINLYYKEWTLAEGEAQLGGLALKVNFPIKFDEEGNLIRPEFEQLNVEKPDFSGDQGKAALDSGINADAKKERKLAQDKLRQDIAHDIRESYNKEEFSPTEYAKKLQKKYKDDAEMKAFIMDSVEEEVRIREYEEFDQLKNELKKSDLSLNQKIGKAMVFKMFRSRISPSDYDAFINELRAIEQQKQEAANQANQANQTAPATT